MVLEREIEVPMAFNLGDNGLKCPAGSFGRTIREGFTIRKQFG